MSSSFGRPINQKYGWTGSEHYVRTHITAPTFLFLFSLIEYQNQETHSTQVNRK